MQGTEEPQRGGTLCGEETCDGDEVAAQDVADAVQTRGGQERCEVFAATRAQNEDRRAINDNHREALASESWVHPTAIKVGNREHSHRPAPETKDGDPSKTSHPGG